jgi:hypothetical protein
MACPGPRILSWCTTSTLPTCMGRSRPRIRRLVAVALSAGTMAIEEVSPRSVGKRGAAATRITMRVNPHTMFVAARRAADGSFVETLRPEWAAKPVISRPCSVSTTAGS